MGRNCIATRLVCIISAKLLDGRSEGTSYLVGERAQEDLVGHYAGRIYFAQ